MFGVPDDELMRRVEAFKEYGSKRKAAEALGISRSTLQVSILRAAERGLMGTDPVLPGYAIKSIASKDENGAWIKQVKEHGEAWEKPEGHAIKGVSALVDGEGRVIQQWVKTSQEAQSAIELMRAAVEELKTELPRVDPVAFAGEVNDNILNQYTVTDNHFGMLAWAEETGADYDLKIAEKLLLDWFAAAIKQSPDAHTGVFAQLGDLMHHDSHESVTPEHRNVLDADSRLQKVIRVVIRTIRRIIAMLLEKHRHVHIIMASGNHDPASSAWLREMLAVMYEDEPRLTVDTSPALYYSYEWGDTALFYHHGHKRTISNVDATLAGTFRELFGRSKYAYAHIGHLHNNDARKSDLMYIERHETLAARDAYAAGGGWLSGRSAKVITYSKSNGEVGRSTLRPEAVTRA